MHPIETIELPPVGGIALRLEILDEDTPVRGNVMASGDAEFDRKVENEILARLDAGDVWAWFLVRTVASFGGFEGDSYLGGCSYRDKEDFKADAYCDDQIKEAIANLGEAVDAAIAKGAQAQEVRAALDREHLLGRSVG